MVRATSARPSGARPDVPAKMTSSILPPRRLLAPCSPITQARASTTLDLPEPLGPTMQVMPGSSCMVVEDAKDLNPLRVRLFRYNAGSSPSGSGTENWGSSARLTLRHGPRRHPLHTGVPRRHAGEHAEDDDLAGDARGGPARPRGPGARD